MSGPYPRLLPPHRPADLGVDARIHGFRSLDEMGNSVGQRRDGSTGRRRGTTWMSSNIRKPLYRVCILLDELVTVDPCPQHLRVCDDSCRSCHRTWHCFRCLDCACSMRRLG